MKPGYGGKRLLRHQMTTRPDPTQARKLGKGSPDCEPGVIDERAFMNAIRNGPLASPKLRAFVREIDYNLAALPDRPLRRRAIASAEEHRFGYTGEVLGSS